MSTKKQVLGRRLYGLLIPAASGKSKLAELVHGRESGKKDIAFIDMDASLVPEEGSSSIDLFPQAKKLVEEKYKDYPKHKIVVISSNRALFNYIKLDLSRQFVFIPTTRFFLKMISNRGLFVPRVSSFVEKSESKPSNSRGSSTPRNSSTPRGSSFTLGKEIGIKQAVNRQISEEELPKLFEKEIEAISNSRDDLSKLKHLTYDSFEELLDQVEKTLI